MISKSDALRSKLEISSGREFGQSLKNGGGAICKKERSKILWDVHARAIEAGSQISEMHFKKFIKQYDAELTKEAGPLVGVRFRNRMVQLLRVINAERNARDFDAFVVGAVPALTAKKRY